VVLSDEVDLVHVTTDIPGHIDFICLAAVKSAIMTFICIASSVRLRAFVLDYSDNTFLNADALTALLGR
jgi:hypothetical protein